MRDASGVWSRIPPLINYWLSHILPVRRLSPKHCPGCIKEIKLKNTKNSREILVKSEQLVIEHRLIQRLGEAHKSSSVAKIVREISTRSTPKVKITWHTRRANVGISSWVKYCSRQNPPFGSNVKKPIGL